MSQRIDMSDFQKDAMLRALMYVAQPETRGYLMRVCPDAYNAYCGREVCAVFATNDLGEAVRRVRG